MVHAWNLAGAHQNRKHRLVPARFDWVHSFQPQSVVARALFIDARGRARGLPPRAA